MSHHYLVVGNPIDHSISPKVHALFAEQTHRNIEYTRLLATKDTLFQELDAFFEAGGNGCNVTLPFKEQVIEYCDLLSPEATLAKSVNTLKRLPDGRIEGHTTDGAGLTADLTQNCQVPVTGQRILIAGAGGTVRGILASLISLNPAEIVIANRTVSRAAELAADFQSPRDQSTHQTTANADTTIHGTGYDAIGDTAFDLVINATSMSLSDQLPPISESAIGQQTVAYDCLYGRETPFMQWATRLKASAAFDGLGMLLEQAAESFYLWEGVRPKSRLIRGRL